MSTWHNDDGLFIKYGPNSFKSEHQGGEYLTFNGLGEQVIEVVLDLTELTATETIVNDLVFVPENAQITRVETVAVVPAATGTAIDVGLIARDRATEVDYDGLLAAAPTANMSAVGETYTFTEAHTVPASATGTGAVVGQEVTASGGAYISASRTDGTAFTAGSVKVRVAYIPKGVDNA